MKTALLSSYLERYELGALVETGLDRGRGSGMGVTVDRYIAIDYQQANVDAARAAGFDARCGDSGTLLPLLLAELDEPALFWLDAHGLDCDNQHPVTADAFPGWEKVPLVRELAAIAAWPHASRSVVLIDDMPEMARWVAVGHGADPDSLVLDRFLANLSVRWDQELEQGVLRLTPTSLIRAWNA